MGSREKNVAAVTSNFMPESRYFQYRADVRIHYRVAGAGPASIVFLHGFASAHDTWLDLASLFPAGGFTLYLIDLKGFGLSDKPRDGAYSVADQAAMVRDFISELKLRSVILAGHSLGGAVALRVCLEAQHGKASFTVGKLVLINSVAYPQREPKFFRRLRTPVIGPLLLRLMPVRRIVRTTLEKVFYNPPAITAELIERYTRYFRGKGIPYALRATIRGIDPADYARIGEEYRRLAVPTLIIWGGRDPIIKLKNGLRLHQDIPGSQLKVLENCGHNPQEERPQETYSILSAFLDAGLPPA